MSSSDAKLVNQKDKDAADLITWRDFEALRNEMRREFRIEDDGLRGEVQEINQKLDATNETVTAMADQMTDIQRSLQALQLAVENLTNQQQQQDEDPDEVPGRGNRPRGWAPLGRHGRGQDEEDGLVMELTSEYTEDRKIKLASSEYAGYALRWWDALVRNRQADGELPIITWRAMKEAMNSRFVPTNYLRTIFDKLTLLRQGVKTVDEYYMEMEMLMQHGRVRESLEMTMQRFLNGLKYDVKGIVHHYSYTNMNQLLHHAREAESQLADEAKVKGRATGAGRFTPRAPPPAAPAPSTRSAPYSTPPSKPVSNVSNAKKSESAASTSGSSMSTARNRDMICHTCGGKGHFKRDCPNRKVMIINEDNEYETGDDVDPNAPDDDDYDTDGEDAYPSDARTIVVSQRALNVLPSASTQRCNLFQTKALVGPDKACKVIIDGGSCRNLASKELCTKLKLKYLPHPHPYYIQWLSDNGEMKVNHMVRVEFEIGPIEFFLEEPIGFSCWRYFYVHHPGAATKLLDDMMINYSEWHTERTPQGKKVNSVKETSSLGDKIDAIMSILANGRSHIDPNNVPLASLVAQEENVDVNFIKSNNFNNNAYRNNYGNNNYRPYPSNNGNGYGNSYGNSYNNNKSVPSGLEVMLKEFISTQTAFNKTVEEKLGKIDVLASKVDSLALDVDLLKLKVMPEEVKDARFAKTNAIQV
ncbi:hypothetical protein QYE76_006422 [Lolium multiflorum]|uniref:CCHC-type domain-containing protein n=1 Tax=Lolium multiflorum TaxID=4521 RepID=A0AAD8RWB3_LOLMU|nr:hypothetical protein QYE76_006422 [Lolium multiflorum]